jgi:hypothetical protein
VRHPKLLVWHAAGEGISPLCDLIGVVPCRTDIEVEPSIVRRVLVKNRKIQYGRLHSSLNTPCTSETSLYAVFEEQAPPFSTCSHGFLIVGGHPQSRSELSSKPGTDSVENEWRSVCHAASLSIKIPVFIRFLPSWDGTRMSEGRWGLF